MTEQYLRSLLDGLEQKKQILDNLTICSEKQYKIVSEEETDWDAFDELVDEKADLIDRLNGLDDGFNSIFGRIKDEVITQKDKYKGYIAELQKGIREVTEKSTSLMALEERTRQKFTAEIGIQKQKIKQNKISSKVAVNYYQSMNRINYVDPQLMDEKK